MPLSVTPSLSSSEGFISDVRDQISNILRFVIMNPGGTSDLWESRLISFRTLSSKYEGDRETLASELERRLNDLFARKFAEYRIDVACTTAPYDPTQTMGYDDDGRYSISFNVLIYTGNTVVGLVDGSIMVDKATNNITIAFSDSPDNQTLS